MRSAMFCQVSAALLALSSAVTGMLATGQLQSFAISGGIADYDCQNACPGWWEGPCRCPLGTDPAHVHDFCSTKTPDAGAGECYNGAVLDRGCVSWESEECYDGPTYQSSCGDSIWNCQNALCNQQPGEPYPESWECVQTDKGPYPCNAWKWGCT